MVIIKNLINNMYLSSESQAALYNKFRPSPPSELVCEIIHFLKESNCPLETAIDIGCGSGQATFLLGENFKNVYGLDNCPEQINEANKNNKMTNVTFRLGSSDFLDFPDGSIQLVNAGQCAHFFNMPKFYKEVNRILQKNGVLAIYGYCLPKPVYENISLELIVKNMFLNTIRPYVSDESILVYIKNYKTEDFEHYPFSDKPVIRYEFDKIMPEASLKELLGYVESWSGFQRLKNVCGVKEADEILNGFKYEILKTLGKSHEEPKNIKLSINFKYFLLLGRKVL